MLFSDLFQETYFALSANKSRSALTILGIVIGIGSVIAMTSIGQGAAKSIEENIQSLGSNLIMVMPGSTQGAGQMVKGGMGSASTLTLEDSEEIAKVSGVEAVAPTVSSRKQVKTTKGTNTNTSIYGVNGSYASVKNVEVELGAFISDTQVNKVSKVAVIGPTTRDDLFGEDFDPVGQKIRIENLEFTVIGMTVSKGASGMNSSDDIIYIPLSTAQQYLTGSKSVSTVNIQVMSEDQMDTVEAKVKSLLLTRHDIESEDDADFSIMNQEDIIETVSSVADTLTLLLGAIAGISLLVGGIGIMNMMLTTVTERTREIGLRKSLGAKNTDISRQFLAEAVSLTFLGGFIGVVLGWGVSLLITKFSSTTTYVSWYSVFLAFGVSALIGIVFGYYPARRAARLNPIEALRYE